MPQTAELYYPPDSIVIQHYYGALQIKVHWEALAILEDGYKLYVSDSRWAGRFTLLSYEKYEGYRRVTYRQASVDRVTGIYRYLGCKD